MITPYRPAKIVVATGRTNCRLSYAITLHQPWASLIALVLKTVETWSWPAPARLAGQHIAVHVGKRVVPRSGDTIGWEPRAHFEDDWHMSLRPGAVLTIVPYNVNRQN